MPVKIRCSGCQKSLNVPDSVRGKVIKCPACETKLKVPAGDGVDAEESPRPAKKPAAAAAKSGARKPSAKAAKSEEDFLSDLDLNRLEDTSSRVCPKCGAEATFEDLECPACGVDFSTGQLSAKAARRKGMRGPDPGEFYGTVWKDAWEFLLKNKGLAFRTGSYWTLFVVLSQCLFLLALVCSTWPPRLFWLALTGLFASGSAGWYWFLSGKIIDMTMRKEKKVKESKFDLLLNAGLGVKAGIWVWGLTFPVILLPVGMTSLYIGQVGAAVQQLEADTNAKQRDLKEKDRKPPTPEEVAQVMGSVSPGPAIFTWMLMIPPAVIAMFMFPIAQIHLNARYSWTAWSLWNMVKASVKNFVPLIYWWLMALVTYLPFVIAGVVLGVYALKGAIQLEMLQERLLGIEKWLLEMAGESPADRGFVAYCIIAVAVVVGLTALMAPLCFCLAFPSVYMMRANGLLGYYNRERLDLINTVKPNALGGYWPRHVAGMADFVILFTVWFMLSLCISFAEYILARFGMDVMYEPLGAMAPGLRALPAIGLLAFAVFTMLYFVNSESGPAQGTAGMRGIGLIVTDMNGKRISPKNAYGRFFGRIVSLWFTGSIGLIMAAFTEKKQTLHDMMSKTLVVFKGDEEAHEK